VAVGLSIARAQDEVFGEDNDALVAGVIAPTAKSSKVDGDCPSCPSSLTRRMAHAAAPSRASNRPHVMPRLRGHLPDAGTNRQQRGCPS
jgi:hypothetical protein